MVLLDAVCGVLSGSLMAGTAGLWRRNKKKVAISEDPSNGSGVGQCRLRFRTRDELLLSWDTTVFGGGAEKYGKWTFIVELALGAKQDSVRTVASRLRFFVSS